EHRGGLSYARGGVLGLARFPAASQEHAAPGRDPYGHRRGPFTALEIQVVLGADPGAARPPAGLRFLASTRRDGQEQAARPSKLCHWLGRAIFLSGAAYDAAGSVASARHDRVDIHPPVAGGRSGTRDRYCGNARTAAQDHPTEDRTTEERAAER